MKTNSICLDFLEFEKCNFGNYFFEDDNFYLLLKNEKVENMFYQFLLSNPLKKKDLDKKFTNSIVKFSVILRSNSLNFKHFNYFKDEEDILAAFLLLFLLKTFSFKGGKRQKDHDFSISSSRELMFDQQDFINFFTDYLFKFFIFNEIKNKIIFVLSKEELRIFVFRFIYLCVEENLVEFVELKINNHNYKYLNFLPFLIPHIPHIVLYTQEFKVYQKSASELYSYNVHFLSITEIAKKATYNDSHFNISLENLNLLQKRYIYIDRSLLHTNWIFLLKDHGLNQDSDLDFIYENYMKIIEKFTIENDLLALRIYHSKISVLRNLIRIKALLATNFDNKKLYSSFKFDFRGRFYELGDYSFTFYKEIRYCLYTGIYDTEVEVFHELNHQIWSVIDDQFKFFSKFLWFESLSLIRKRACVWIFVSLGGLKKSELGIKVKISVFILKGLELWQNSETLIFSDPYEMMEFNYYIFLVKELQSLDPLKKWFFWKDAPASCFEHLLGILGPGSSESYAICNLDSVDTYYDPYGYLIKDFKEKNEKLINVVLMDKANLKLTKDEFEKVFSRNRLKKVFMTESYGAGHSKLTSFFILDLDFDNYKKSEKDAIMSIWESMFDYMSENNILFAHGSKEIIKWFKSHNVTKMVNPDTTEVDLSCFKIEVIQKEAYIRGKRRTLKTQILTSKPNKAQFNISLRANVVHTLDATLARDYVLNTNMWCVHDCFSIDFLNITFEVALVNELMNQSSHNIEIAGKRKRRIFGLFLIR